MDKAANHEETNFSNMVEHCWSKTFILDNQCQIVSRKEEERPCSSVSSTQSVKTPLKRAQKTKTREERKERRETVSVSSTSSLESLHVQRVYDQIAPHIEDLKQRTWPRVKEFLKSLKAGSLVADIGCGNGRYLHINTSTFKIGSDICQPFLHTAAARGFEVLLADNLHLPFRDGIFDAAISIGVIHHFASVKRRVRALQELVRVLLPGGLMMVYVWAFEQKYRKFDSQDILVPWHKPRQADSRYGRPRTSSLSELDHLSASFTGSSFSDEDMTSCRSHRHDSSPDLYHAHQLGALGSTMACQCSNHQRAQKRDYITEDCLHKHTHGKHEPNFNSVRKIECSGMYETSACAENEFNLAPFEDSLGKEEALIRECQKVESYLSSLCKSSWEFSPERRSSSSVRNVSSFGSFEEGALTNTTKSSPSWQSLSLQDDDVFVEKYDSPILDSPEKTESLPTKPSEAKRHLPSCSVGGSATKDLQPLSSTEINHCHGYQTNLSDQKGTVDSFNVDSVHKGNYIVCRATAQKDPNATVNFPVFPDNRERELHVKQEIGNTFSRCEDSFHITETDVVPVNRLLPNNSHNIKSPRGMLDMLKQGLMNMFGKPKQENGRKAAPCFVPCFASEFPEEQFQIREFPQSSLPSNTALEKTVPLTIGSSGNGQNALLEGSFSSKEFVKKTDVCKCQIYSQNPITYHLMKDHSKCQNTAAVYSSNDVCTVGKKSGSQSSMPEPESTENGRSISRKLQCKGMPSPVSGRSQYSKSLKQLPKHDTFNTDLCRFYHVFCEGELEELIIQHVPGVRVVDSFYDHANWCVIVQKV